MRLRNIFVKKVAIPLRKWLIENIDFKSAHILYRRSHYIVINPTNFCPIGCANCLYSSINGPKSSFKSLKKNDIRKIIEIMKETQVKMVVFSGGGEPIENLLSILEILEKVESLQDSIIITSGYFAETSESTKKIMDQITNSAWAVRVKKGLLPIKLTIRISYDNDHCRKISVGNIANIVQYIKNQNSSLLKVLIRTILGQDEDRDIEIAEFLNLKLLPPKIKKFPFRNLPILDGLPCRWLCDRNNNFHIPVIYKPIYFVGRVQGRRKPQEWSYKKIVISEIKSGTLFNLCLRGPKGEGHNYYETLFKGYKFWKLVNRKIYDTPKSEKDKELALYLTADARFVVNNGVPDLFIGIKDLKNWNEFLKYIYSDPIQRALIEKGPFYIQKIAQEVVKDLSQKIDKANFVFSIVLFSLESAALRLYVTIRLIQQLYKEKKIYIKNKRLLNIVTIPIADCQKMFLAKNTLECRKDTKDPIIGNEKGLFYVDVERYLNTIFLLLDNL